MPRPHRPVSSPHHALALCAAALATVACARTGKPEACSRPDLSGCVVEDVDIVGNQALADDEIEERIATAESQHAVGGALQHVPILGPLDRLTVDYERFDRFVLERDMARVERIYRSHGFYEARARAARVTKRKDGTVRVEIAVVEGPPVLLGRVDLAWKDWALPLAEKVTRPVTDAKNDLAIDERFEEEAYEKTKHDILRAMTDRGFAYANVQGSVAVDLVTHRATVLYTLELGPKCTFGTITFDGLGEIPEDVVRDALEIREGQDFSTSALESAQYALADFGVFGTIDVRPQLSTGPERVTAVPVVFVVQPAALRSVRFGVGAQLGSSLEQHFISGWENKNLFGGLRRFSVELRPGFVFWPTSLDTLFDQPPNRVLPQFKAFASLRQPLQHIDARSSIVTQGAFSLAVDETQQRRDDTPILGYRSYAGGLGLERAWWNSQVFLRPSINIQLSQPFSYNEIDPPDAYRDVTVTYLEAVGQFDLRRDARGRPNRLQPNYGMYLATTTQMAGFFLGGDASDVRVRPEIRAYAPISRKVTLAARLGSGLLFANNYGTRLADTTPAPQRIDTGAAAPFADENTFAADVQLVQLRGLLSGGPYSNRGYAYGGIGPHAFLCTAGCSTGELAAGVARRYELVAVGGLALWEASLELRVPLSDTFATAFFLDASDVTRTRTFRLTHPHVSAGFGLRYETPVGALRADLALRIPCLQVIGTETVDTPDGPVQQCKDLPPERPDPATNPGVLDEGPQGALLGLPMAFSIAIGEAF